jgi:hypothetical protein
MQHIAAFINGDLVVCCRYLHHYLLIEEGLELENTPGSRRHSNTCKFKVGSVSTAIDENKTNMLQLMQCHSLYTYVL